MESRRGACYNRPVELRILGPLEVRTEEGVVSLPRRRERVLLAALLLRSGVVVSTDQLVEAIWGETPPRTATGSLQNAISELRKALGHDVVRTRPPGYVLEVEPEAVDARRFEQAVQEAATQEAPERAETLAAALALWRGPALADLADEPFARGEASRLDDLRLAATEDRLDADLQLGRGADLVAEIEAHVTANPLRERLRGQLLVALYRAGRQAEALEAYQDARRALVDGLGIDPSPALAELERRVLRQDPSLLARADIRAAEPTAAPAQLKTVTVLAATLDGVGGLDPEALRGIVDRFLDAVRTSVARYGGTLDRFLGSEAVAVFGVPAVHEDDALRAARAAVELREALTGEGEAVRIGLATGEALVAEGDAPVVGDVVAVAAALRDAAAPGGILAAEATLALIRDAVDAGAAVTVGTRALEARPLAAVRGAHGRAQRLDAPLQGREEELGTLRDALAQATAEQRCVAVTVLGEPGIGKTRLAAELARTLMRGRVLEGRCVPYGEGATYRPVLDLLSRAGGDVTEEALAGLLPAGEDGALAARQLAALASPGTAVPRGEVLWAVRVLLESLAGDDPLVVVLEDVHWAEPALLDLVEYLVERVAQPVLLLCPARPELLDERPAWAGGLPGMSVLRLAPLASDDARALLAGVAGDGLDARASARVLDRAAGNPLHLEQLAAFVLDEGGDPALDEVPPTIEALLASRLDALAPAPRETLQRAAVAGSEFTRGAVVALSADGAPVDASLLELTRRGIIRPERAPGPDDTYRFHHVLLRDVAYGSLPKAARAKLHERAAAWLDRDGPGPDEVVGWHLEHAYRYRSEMRPGDPELPQLAEEAGERLGRAGIRAAKSSNPTVTSLLRRATGLLPDATLRTELLLELGPWLRTAGDMPGSRLALGEALQVAHEIGDKAQAARARIELAWDAAAMRTVDRLATFRDLVTELLPVLDAAQDNRGLQRAWQLLTSAYLYDERMEAVANAARRALLYARAAGWPPKHGVMALGSALVHGPSPIPRAIVEAEALRSECGDSRDLQAVAATVHASLHAMAGDHEVAAGLMAASRATHQQLDDRLALLTYWTPHRLTQFRLHGDVDGARRLLSAWIEELREAGNDAFLSTALVQLADLVVDEAPDDAIRLVDEASARASPDDRLVQALLRSVSAKRSAATGNECEAGRLVGEARAILGSTDAICDRARILVASSRALELCGDDVEASSALREAYDLYKAKGNVCALRSLDQHGTRAIT